MLSLNADKRYNVGPAIKTKRSKQNAKVKLISLNIFTPFPTPEMAENTAKHITTTITPTCKAKLF